ncbi:hypothetical protein PM082_009552 [Marasmius tenuissimus]|nr:hypothetical protein PM082_009552 [Marasmius tenuissimus]
MDTVTRDIIPLDLARVVLYSNIIRLARGLWSVINQAGANVVLDTSATLPRIITVSQTITAGWYLDEKPIDPFDFQLIYLGSDSRPTSTQTLATQVKGILGADGVTRGTLAFAASATGPVELVAINTDTRTSIPTSDKLYTVLIPIPIGVTIDSARSTSTPEGSSSLTTTSPDASTTLLSNTGTQSPHSTHDEKPKGVLIGSIIGGVTFLVSVVLFALLRRCRGRQKVTHPEGFCRDMMVLRTTETDARAMYATKEKGQGGSEGTGRCFMVHPIPSTPTLQESKSDQREDQISLCTSVSSHSNAEKRSLAVSSIGSSSVCSEDAPIPPLIPVSIDSPRLPAHLKAPSRARTDRQMWIEEKIMELQGHFITASGSAEEKGRTRAKLQEKIEKVKSLRESQWACGGKGEVPEDLID